MSDFSRLNIEAIRETERLLKQAEIQPATAFPPELSNPKEKAKRLRFSQNNIRFFEKYYFPPEIHKRGYFKPNEMLCSINRICREPGFHLVLGPRGYGKTVKAMINTIWLLLTGRISFLGTYSETLDKARILMRSISSIIQTNPRLQFDYGIEIEIENENEVQFRLKSHLCSIKPYSPERSVKGAIQIFDRIDYLLCDDIASESSSTDENIVFNLWRRLEEAYKSLADGCTMLILGNNHSPDCIYNLLLIMQDESKLPPGHFVHVFPAWDSVKNKPLWSERYPAGSEEELQDLHEADDEEWSGNFMQRPERKGGYLFPVEYWTEYSELPDDAFGVGYCDPNLALKTEISDTTAMGAMLYSPTTNLFYCYLLRCLPFSNADELLNAYFNVFDQKRVFLLSFDGNVDQEAEWYNFVLFWCQRHNRPYPVLDFRRYNVDLHAKSVQIPWIEKRILFPKSLTDTEEGRRFKKQITRFKGKKNKSRGQKVDAADWLICVFQVLHDPKIRLGELYKREIKFKTFDEPFEF